MPSAHQEAVSCPACGSATTEYVRPYRSHSPAFRSCTLRHCAACGFDFAHPMPADAELDAYNASYFDHAHGGLDAAVAARRFHSAINRLRVEHVEEIRRSLSIDVRRVLEIGPGLGDFSSHWRALHPATEYHVLESDASCRARLESSGLVVHASLAELPAGVPSFDLLVMSHVLEHTSDPHEFLGALVDRLTRGALVFIEVPCRDHEHKSEDEPHLLFFDRQPMQRLLERCGVAPLKISYHGIEIGRLKAGRFSRRSVLRRLLDRTTRVVDARGLLPVPSELRVLADPADRAAVRSHEAHLEKKEPSWWLRAVGRVSGAPA